MINSLKNNKALRGNQRHAFKDLKVSHKSGKPLVFESKMSKEELQELRKTLKRQRLIKDIIFVMVIVVALAIAGYFTYLILKA